MSACAMPASPARIARVALEPDAGSWGALMHEHIAQRGDLGPDTLGFREQVGLPADRPIVMGGHQAALWHPGILSKLLAADALARRTGAVVAWLVVDQDANDPFGVAIPERADRAPFRAGEWRAGPDAAGRPAMRVPAATPNEAPDAATALELSDRFERIRRALLANAGAPSAAAQLTEALFDLLDGIADRPRVVYASQIARTDLFARVMERTLLDPDGTRAAYNDAAQRHPDAGVRPLARNATGGIELPVWRLDPHGRRAPVYHDQVSDDVELVPRGMLATGLARLAACDLFVHGTGGAAYEPINDAWVPSLMGSAPLAPFVTATADVHLLLSGELVAPANAARARWAAHHARHHPGMLGDHDAQHARDALIARIEEMPAGSPGRAEAFAALHELLRAARDRNAAALGALTHAADDLEGRTDRAAVALDRGWSVALHDPATLWALRDRIGALFG